MKLITRIDGPVMAVKVLRDGPVWLVAPDVDHPSFTYGFTTRLEAVAFAKKLAG